MLARLRPRVTYANVMATVAVFLALGGGALAATSFIGSNGQIHACVGKKGQLTVLKPGKKCGKGKSAIAWNQQGRQGVRGKPGPSTGPAGGALAGSYPNPTLRCPAGTTFQSGFCYESSVRAAAMWSVAAQTCATAGRRLATPSELWAVAQRSDVAMTNDEWTSTWFIDTNSSVNYRQATTVSEIVAGPGQGVHLSSSLDDSAVAYRCVVNAGSP